MTAGGGTGPGGTLYRAGGAAPRIDAILMASGFSRRFGAQNKLLLPFEGRPLAAHTLELAVGMPQLGRVVLVYADDAVARLAEGLPVACVKNEHPEHGSRESVRLGVQAARADADYYLFFTCDQPLLDEATVRLVLAGARPGAIVTPCHAGTPGNPVLYDACFKEELCGLREGEKARVLKQRHPHTLVNVEVPNPLALRDVDTQEDLAELTQSAKPTLF